MAHLIEFYWDDLTEKKKAEIRETLNLGPDDNNNWDVVPMTTMFIEDPKFEEWKEMLVKFYEELGIEFHILGDYGYFNNDRERGCDLRKMFYETRRIRND